MTPEETRTFVMTWNNWNSFDTIEEWLDELWLVSSKTTNYTLHPSPWRGLLLHYRERHNVRRAG